MAIFCSKCGSKVGVTGPCKTCKKARLREEEDSRFGKDRDEWRHEAVEQQRLK